MIERLIYRALKEGLAAFTAKPVLLEDLFLKQHGLDQTEFDALKLFFRQSPPTVVHGYAHTSHKFPLYSIILDGENESTAFLNRDGAPLDPDDEDYPGDAFSSIWSHSYSVLTYAEHPDVTRYYYEIAKTILIAAFDYFSENGVTEMVLSGMDLAPDPRYLPEHLFLRRLTFKCEHEFQWMDPNPVLKAFKVTGISVDSSGSPSDVGGVKTLVTVANEGEE